MGHATPDPGAVAERRTLASGTVDLGDAIDASGGARSANEIAVECAAHIPGVVLNWKINEPRKSFGCH